MAKLDKTPIKQSDKFTPEAEAVIEAAPEIQEFIEAPADEPVVETAHAELPAPPVAEKPSPKVSLDGVLCTLDPQFVETYYKDRDFPLTSRGVLYIFKAPDYEVRLPESEAKEYAANKDHPVRFK